MREPSGSHLPIGSRFMAISVGQSRFLMELAPRMCAAKTHDRPRK